MGKGKNHRYKKVLIYMTYHFINQQTRLHVFQLKTLKIAPT